MASPDSPHALLRRLGSVDKKKQQAKSAAEKQAAKDATRKALNPTQRDEAIRQRDAKIARENKEAAELARQMAGSSVKQTPDVIWAKKMQAQEKAQEQARKDALQTAKEINTSVRPGAKLPLHVLNARQRANDRAARDEVREATTAAAKAVQKSLAGSIDARRAARHVRKSGVEKVMRDSANAAVQGK